jgi:hypothetical protein
LLLILQHASQPFGGSAATSMRIARLI